MKNVQSKMPTCRPYTNIRPSVVSFECTHLCKDFGADYKLII